MKPNFDYTIPNMKELRELYIQPYRFSDELIKVAYYIFTHPNFKYHKLFFNLHKQSDINDMLKRPFLMIRYYQDNPQQFGHSLNNLVPHIAVAMWKTFLALQKFRGTQFTDYKAMNFKRIDLFENKLLDVFIEDINNKNFTYEDENIKYREGVELRGGKPMGYSKKQLDYYDSLD